MSNPSDLNKLLHQIFEDGIVEPEEHQKLAVMARELSAEQTTATFREFLHEKWGEVIADDVITGTEVRLLGTIMEELKLQIDHLPHQARVALKDLI